MLTNQRSPHRYPPYPVPPISDEPFRSRLFVTSVYIHQHTSTTTDDDTPAVSGAQRRREYPLSYRNFTYTVEPGQLTNSRHNGWPSTLQDGSGPGHSPVEQHDHEPLQVLPVDQAHSSYHFHVRGCCADSVWHPGLLDRGQVEPAWQAERRPVVRVLRIETLKTTDGAERSEHCGVF